MAKRKPGLRHPCGKLRQPGARERSDIAAHKARLEAEFVQHQPHRRSFAVKDDPWLENELGRFCRRQGLRREVYEAALEWAEIVRLYRAAWGAPLDENHGGGGGGEGPSMETQAKWKAQMQQIEEDLYGPDGRNKARCKATSDLVVRRIPVPRELVEYAKAGLILVAIRLAKISERDTPYQRAA